MEGFHWLLIASLLVPVVFAIGAAASTSSVKTKFANLGVIAGKTRSEIYAAVGPPNSISSIGPGKEVLQWQVTGYHIALIFTGDICDGVSHEYAA